MLMGLGDPHAPHVPCLGCIYHSGWRIFLPSVPILLCHHPQLIPVCYLAELQLDEETGLNPGHGLGISWGFMGSFMFLVHPFREPACPLRGAIKHWVV